MMRKSDAERLRSSFLAKAVVTALAMWLPITLAAARVPIPPVLAEDPAMPTESTTYQATPTKTVTDRELLVAFYHATNGDRWLRSDSWDTDTPIDGWYGVVTDSGDRVVELDLSANRLSGSIPSELGELTELEILNLSDNGLSGPVPPELGKLTKLGALNLRSNQLSGEIPPELGNLNKLESLNLSSNQFGGKIPPELGKLTALETLVLSDNKLNGAIPPELGKLTDLESLSLDSNHLSGTIPPDWGDSLNWNGLTSRITV